MNRRARRRPNFFLTSLLLVAIAIMVYVDRVVVPTTPPLFIPTPTATTSPEAFVNQAEDLFRAGKIPQAIDAYKNAISSDPTNPAYYISLARFQVFAGQYDDAIQNAQNALLKNPNNPLAHAVLGWALGFKEKYAEAEIELQQALQLEPNNALAHAYYAEVLINQGDYELQDKAIEQSRLARDLDSSLLEVHRARGLVLLNTGNVDEAIDELQKAIAINKNIPDLQLNLGVAYKAAQQYEKAQEALLAAYALNPKDPIGLTELSRSYFADGRYGQAAQFAEEAVKVEPSNPRLHGNLGIIYYKQNLFDKAIPELTLAVRGGTTADGVAVEGLPLDYNQRIMEYYWYLGYSFAKGSRCAEAVPVFEALLRGVPNDETAVYNANDGISVCTGSQETPTAPPEETGTPTP